ncbi:Glyoxylase, beta-lactamase superfamily II [Granulicella pectinivorans]|uniref:Glyoxylase, beta-lactamase superfamily II n=1 Tax=Granulicella pectinivorans TaxID=474950 RepID=A0A1I6M615_9BACT|nr:MBL fold metallo-hydrolase [Granulicella pectinivorans]SFS11137.1 Glyoxylase, beta-lactamase superfamily II [Granulicella pectinivorans]
MLIRCVLANLVLSTSLHAQFAQPDGGSVRPGRLPLSWSTGGPRCMEMPEWQVHEYNPDLFILRQSGCTDYEKPFVYLFFGKDRALLYDTGSRKGNLAPTLQHVMHQWMQRNQRTSMPLVVVHSHSHGDHVAGDAGIQALNDPAMPITFVAAAIEPTRALYNIANWPEDTGSIDLGDRVIDAIPIPGHDAVSVALYDRHTGVLLTGDSLYPGRIYIRDFDAFVRSTTRLVQFTQDKPIAHILGCHIEETRTPFLDYPTGTLYQPDEHELSLSRGALLEMEAALESLHGSPKRVAYRDFSLWPSGPAFRAADRSQSSFEKVQQYQLGHMWDQTKP